MCEFKVFIGKEKVFDDAVFCSVNKGTLVVKDILGQSKQFSNCHIAELNVTSETLILEYD